MKARTLGRRVITLFFLTGLWTQCGGEIARFELPRTNPESDFNQPDEIDETGGSEIEYVPIEITEGEIPDETEPTPPSEDTDPPATFCGDGECRADETAQSCPADCTVNPNPVYHSNRVALTDLGTDYYRPVASGEAFQGGLYPNGSNTMPADHLAAGIAAAQRVRPLAYNANYACGTPGAPGYRCPSNPVGPRVVMISIGMSNTSHSFCSTSSDTPTACSNWTFMGRAAAASSRHPDLTLINGASNMQTATQWYPSVSDNRQPPSYSLPDSIVYNQPGDGVDSEYDRIRLNLNARGLSEAQVQVAWVKLANPLWAGPPAPASLPSTNAEAYRLTGQLGQVIRTLKQRYPNLQQVFLTSRIYAGYANTFLNPEPYAYEYGFAVKWAVEAQISQMRAGGAVVNSRVGDLDYNDGTAPWISWASYLWADGTNARGDGLTWERSDFFSANGQGDGTHPNQQGQSKVAAALMEFFANSPVTRCWFVQGGVCR